MKKILENKKTRILFSLYSISIIFLTVIPTVYAEEDPINIVNNLSNLIFQLITAIGGIILGMGVFQFGMSWKSHDPSQRSNGLLGILGGIIIVSAKFILDYITK